jgi:hypothetical protein
VRRFTHRVVAGTVASAAALALALLAPGVVAAAGGSNLLPNGTFDGGSTSGWQGSNASLSAVSPGFSGSAFAAQVALSNTSTSYNMHANPKPAIGVPQGEQFQASAEVSGVAGRSLCLLLLESGTTAQTVKACVTATGAWQALGPVTLTDQTAGDSVGYQIRQTGATTGDSFEADSLSMIDVDTTAPTAPGSLTASAVSSGEIDLSWSVASDPDFSGVCGYAIYRDGASTPLATVPGSANSYQDTSVTAGSTHTYQVAAFDYAKNYSPLSDQASATTSGIAPGALWHMDETSGTTMVDSSGNGDNGTLHKVTLGVPGFSGTAYSFNGNSSYVSVPNSPSLNPGLANINISFDLKTTSLPTQGDYDLVRKGTFQTEEYKIELLQSGQVSCVFRGSTDHFNATGGSGLNNGSWHQIQCIKTSSQVQLVIDGTVVKTTTGTVGSIANTYNVDIGAYPGSDWYKGSLDEVSISFG